MEDLPVPEASTSSFDAEADDGELEASLYAALHHDWNQSTDQPECRTTTNGSTQSLEQILRSIKNGFKRQRFVGAKRKRDECEFPQLGEMLRSLNPSDIAKQIHSVCLAKRSRFATTVMKSSGLPMQERRVLLKQVRKKLRRLHVMEAKSEVKLSKLSKRKQDADEGESKGKKARLTTVSHQNGSAKRNQKDVIKAYLKTLTPEEVRQSLVPSRTHKVWAEEDYNQERQQQHEQEQVPVVDQVESGSPIKFESDEMDSRRTKAARKRIDALYQEFQTKMHSLNGLNRRATWLPFSQQISKLQRIIDKERKRDSDRRCVNCGDVRHVTCSKYCYVCNVEGHSATAVCTSNMLSLRCVRCHQDGHKAADCPEQWRQYHSTTEDVPPVVDRTVNALRSCPNCGRSGHFYAECRLLRPSQRRTSFLVSTYDSSNANEAHVRKTVNLDYHQGRRKQQPSLSQLQLQFQFPFQQPHAQKRVPDQRAYYQEQNNFRPAKSASRSAQRKNQSFNSRAYRN